MGICVELSNRCFFVFFCRISLINDVIPPLSPLFIPSISSITMTNFCCLPFNKFNTLQLDILLHVMESIIVLFRTSPASYRIIS